MLKKVVKYFASLSPVALTKNEQYDRLTKKILQQACNANSVCVDVGANEGKVLQMMLKTAPLGKHYAFEPIPVLFKKLQTKFKNKANIFNIALSNELTTSQFNLVTTNMAYSGLKKRAYDKPEKDTTIEVTTDLLDNIIPATTKITLIKIDVEGAELQVLKGAIKTIQNAKPVLLFEFGKAGANAYNINDYEMFQFINQQLEYQIYTLTGWLKKEKSLSFSDFSLFFCNNKEYFFVAVPL